MTAANMNLADLIGLLIGFSFTIFILSYILGDNFLFRFATHIFIGAAAGYASVVTIYNVILPQLIFPLMNGGQGEMILTISLLIPSLLLLAKISPRLSKIGNPAMAILVGIGAAVAIGGGIFGTIFPQVSAAVNVFETNNFLEGAILLIGTFTTLLYFQFNSKQSKNQRPAIVQATKLIRWIGKAFIAITFGALFAGVYVAALTALIERFSFLWTFIKELVLPAALG
ncbi:MAG: hypothetical protein ISR58_00865 [Anaerolineales bacterium]|nr:hypothetical protein [Chloroflexota bacterium]MBL6979715.1 hypothetical protein [Anaerolineales bacterium]